MYCLSECVASSCVEGSCVETDLVADTVCDDGDATTVNDVCDGQGSCSGITDAFGCLDSNATNYDPNANAQSFTYDDAGNVHFVHMLACADIPDNDDNPATAFAWMLMGYWSNLLHGGKVGGTTLMAVRFVDFQRLFLSLIFQIM